MSYDSEHKEKTRQRVLDEAAKAIRAEGPHRVGVAAVMAKAGMTHGGFYAHFASKDDLVAAAIGRMFEEGRARLEHDTQDRTPAEGLSAYIDFYLSRGHRDTRVAGCPLPFLAADAPRLTGEARGRFAKGAAALRSAIAARLADVGHADAEAEASSVLSEMVGALSLARAEPDKERSAAILANSKSSLKRRLGLETPQ